MKFKSYIIEKFYFKNQNESMIELVIDFLNAKYFNKKSINFSYKQALMKAEIWKAKSSKEVKQIELGKVEVVTKLSNDKILVQLKDEKALKWESYYMNNCVAKYSHNDEIYSIRNKEHLPCCTLQVDEMCDYIIQAKDKSNRFVSPKVIKYLIEVSDKMGFLLSDTLMEEIGYTSLVDLNFIQSYFDNYKIIEFNEEKYLFKNNKLKLIKKFKENDYDLFLYFIRCNFCPEAIKLFIKNKVNFKQNKNYALMSACENDLLKLLRF